MLSSFAVRKRRAALSVEALQGQAEDNGEFKSISGQPQQYALDLASRQGEPMPSQIGIPPILVQ